MSFPITPVLIGLGSGMIGTLATIFLSPRLQHHFWKRQRFAELRLAVAQEVNQHAANFYIVHVKNDSYELSARFLTALEETEGKVKVLFSDEAFQSYKKMQRLIAATGGRAKGLGPQGVATAYDFLSARDAALAKLYEEAVGRQIRQQPS